MSYVTQAKVIKIIEHSEEVREFVLEVDIERKYNPGSFVQLSLDLVTASDIWPDSRTFSIASYEKKIMRFIIKKVGIYTSRIFNELSIGTRCTVKFPFGDLFNKKIINEKHLLIAGGLGITPYISIVKYFKENDLIDKIHLFYSVKYFKDLLFYNELNSILGEQMQLFITGEYINNITTQRIKLKDIKNVVDVDSNIYLSGSKSFIFDYKNLLTENGFNKIHLDQWE